MRRLLVAGLAAGLMASWAADAQGPGAGPGALVRFDPRTETFQGWAIPSGVGIIRHMRATPGGHLVIHQSSSNRVGLVTIGPASVRARGALGVVPSHR